MRKNWIEDIVIKEITKIIFDNDTIESIISMVLKIQSEDNKVIPLYESQIMSIQKSIDNMLNAIQAGVFTESTKERLEELENSKKTLEAQIAAEKLRKPILKPENLRNWFYKLRALNTDKIEHRRVLVDTFVNKIFLYDDKIIITFNYKSDTKEVTFKNLESSEIKKSISPHLACPIGQAFLFV